MTVAVKVLFNRLPGASERLVEHISDIVEITAGNIAADARKRAPRRTGHLADDSIDTYDDGPTTWIVEVSTLDVDIEEYAAYVEYGTTQAPAQPYLTPAAEAERPRFLNKIQRALDRGSFV